MRVEAITSRLEAIAIRVEAIASGLEAIALVSSSFGQESDHRQTDHRRAG